MRKANSHKVNWNTPRYDIMCWPLPGDFIKKYNHILYDTRGEIELSRMKTLLHVFLVICCSSLIRLTTQKWHQRTTLLDDKDMFGSA